MSAIHDEEFYHVPDFQAPRLHPMKADIGVSAREAVEEHIKSSKKLKSI